MGGVSGGGHHSAAEGHIMFIGNICLLINTLASAVYYLGAKKLVQVKLCPEVQLYIAFVVQHYIIMLVLPVIVMGMGGIEVCSKCRRLWQDLWLSLPFTAIGSDHSVCVLCSTTAQCVWQPGLT